MEKDSKIFVAGHRGLVGSAILNNLRSKGYTNFLLRTHAELDLTDQAAVNEFLPLNGRTMCSCRRRTSAVSWRTVCTVPILSTII